MTTSTQGLSLDLGDGFATRAHQVSERRPARVRKTSGQTYGLGYLRLPLGLVACVTAIVSLPAALCAVIPLWLMSLILPGFRRGNPIQALGAAFCGFGLACAYIVLCSVYLPNLQHDADASRDALLLFAGNEYVHWLESYDGVLTLSPAAGQAAIIMASGAAILFSAVLFFSMGSRRSSIVLRLITIVLVGAVICLPSLVLTAQAIRIVSPSTPLASMMPRFGDTVRTIPLDGITMDAITGDDPSLAGDALSRYDGYRLALARPATLAVDVETALFAPRILIEAPGKVILDLAADSPGPFSIAQELPAGSYTINVAAVPEAAGASPQGGAYKLNLRSVH